MSIFQGSVACDGTTKQSSTSGRDEVHVNGSFTFRPGKSVRVVLVGRPRALSCMCDVLCRVMAVPDILGGEMEGARLKYLFHIKTKLILNSFDLLKPGKGRGFRQRTSDSSN